MPLHSRFLGGGNASPPAEGTPLNAQPPAVDSISPNYIVIIVVLICAAICILGLAMVARYDWLHRLAAGRDAAAVMGTTITQPPAAANKGLKKKILKSLPKLIIGGGDDRADNLSECSICLAEFAAGEEVRVLPQCGHGYHVVCIDAWLGTHSSCPSCRRNLAISRCRQCGTTPPPSLRRSPPEATA